MIAADGISYSSGKKKILDEVTFSSKSGEVIALVGPNGAGKSTLLKILAGALKPSKGKVLLNDQFLHQFNPKELARKRAVLSQQYAMSVNFLIEEIVMMGRYPHFNSAPESIDFSIVRKIMKRTGVDQFKGRHINQLSGGEQQRVHLARVLVQVISENKNEKGVLLLDEPVSSLDLQYQHIVLQIAKEMSNDHHSVIIVLHDLNLAARYADRIIILQNGMKRADDVPNVVLNSTLLSDVYQTPLTTITNNGQLIVIPKNNVAQPLFADSIN